jgi:hypothetical protein
MTVVVSAALASPAWAGAYVCHFKGQPLILIDTTYEHERLTIGDQSAKLQSGNGFLTGDIDDKEYIFSFAHRSPDDPKIQTTLVVGDYRGETICVRQ